MVADSDAIRRVGETPCLPGTYSLGADNCSTCADGYAASTAGTAACTICDAGTVPNTNHTGCIICLAGTFSTTGAVECTSCDAGKYSDDEADACTSCDAGTASSIGASNCTSCDAGTYSSTAASSCTSCGAGKYSTAGSDSCSACNTGSDDTVGLSSVAGSAECEKCESGYYRDGNACEKCSGDGVDCDSMSELTSGVEVSYATLEALPMAAGWFRFLDTSGSAQVYECTYAPANCEGSSSGNDDGERRLTTPSTSDSTYGDALCSAESYGPLCQVSHFAKPTSYHFTLFT